jgi:hypothetical protein
VNSSRSLLLVAALASCGKASDLPKLEEEATDLAQTEKARFDELDRRANDLVIRGRAMKELGNPPPQIDNAGEILGDGRSHIEDIRNTIQRSAGEVANAMKSATPGPTMVVVIDGMRTRFELDETIAVSDIETVESWMDRASGPAPKRGEQPLPPAGTP